MGFPAALLVAVAIVLAVAFAGDATAAGDWARESPAPTARSEIALARAGRYAYSVGGFDERSRSTGRVERYDLVADRWSRLPDLPLLVNHPAAATWRGDLYVVGGYASPTGLDRESAALFRYDIERRRWSRLPSMRVARGALTAQVIGDRLYAVGGAAGGRALPTVEVFDLRRRRWSSAPAMPTAREHLGSAVVGGRLYVVAGRSAGRNFKTLERYDPRRRRWARLPDALRERGGNAAAAVGRRIVAVGGEEAAGAIGFTEYFDTARNRWARVADMLTPRHGLGAVGYRGRVYAIQGGPVPGFSSSPAVESLAVP